jgi:alpha-beta hydrolase superfamily lysophospholipase
MLVKLRLVLMTLFILAALAACNQGPEPGEPEQPIVTDPNAAHGVIFDTSDGLSLPGTFYGSGPTAIVISHMYNEGRSNWSVTARALAEEGYTVFVYTYRGLGGNAPERGKFNARELPLDLRGAIAFVRDQLHAERVVLLGATLGGTVTIKVAGVENPDAVILLSPAAASQGLEVSDDDVKMITAPKLFIAAEEDPYRAATEHMAAIAPAPKARHIYPGSEFGNSLFTKHRDGLTRRILDFLKEHVPATAQ